MENEISQDQFGRWFLKNRDQSRSFTILTKLPGDRRGVYSEEVDVLAGTVGQAMRIAKIVLSDGYDPALRISRVLRNW